MAELTNYTEKDVLYFLEENCDLKGDNGRKRHILDRRNYIMHILYCKFGKTEYEISKILKIKRTAVHHSKYHAYYWKDDEDFKLNTERLRKTFPYIAVKPLVKKKSFKHKLTVLLDDDEYEKLKAFKKKHDTLTIDQALKKMIRLY